MMQTAENRRDTDAVAVANPMAGRHRSAVWRVGNARPQARVRTSAIVVGDRSPEDLAEVNLVEQNHPVQAFAPNRANQPFAGRVRLRRSHRCLENGEPIAAIVRSTPSE